MFHKHKWREKERHLIKSQLKKLAEIGILISEISVDDPSALRDISTEKTSIILECTECGNYKFITYNGDLTNGTK